MSQLRNKFLKLFLAAGLILSVMGGASAQWVVDETNNNVGEQLIYSDSSYIYTSDFQEFYRINQSNISDTRLTTFSDSITPGVAFDRNGQLTIVAGSNGNGQVYNYSESTGGINLIGSFGQEFPNVEKGHYVSETDTFYLVETFINKLELSSFSTSIYEDVTSMPSFDRENDMLYYLDGSNLVEKDLITDSTTNLVSVGDDGPVAYHDGYVYYINNGPRDTLSRYDLSSGTLTDVKTNIQETGSAWAGLEVSNTGQFIISYTDNYANIYDKNKGYETVLNISEGINNEPYFSDDDKFLFYKLPYGELRKYQTSGLVLPPSASINQPLDGEEFVLDYGESNTSVNYDFTVNTEGLETDYNVTLNGSNIDSGTLSASASASSVTGSTTQSEGTYNIQIEVSNDGGTATSDTNSFTVSDKAKPFLQIDRPTDGSSFLVESGSSVDIPFEGWINQSKESGDAYIYAQPESFQDNYPYNSPEIYEKNVGSFGIDEDFRVNDNLSVSEPGSYEAIIYAQYPFGGGFTSNVHTFSVDLANPVITDFTVSSDEVQNLENIQPGDYFDLALEGSINENEIDYVEYRVEDSSGTVLDSVQRSPNYQDSNIFTDSVDDAFQMQEAWAGKTLDIEAQATDTSGLTSSLESVQVQTGTPPNEFLLNSPNVGEFFLIPEGQNEVEVDIDYGVDSSELAGDLKLYVNGQQQATESVGSNTQQTFTYTDTYTEGTKTWYLEWTDSTGETYTSSTSNFEVSQYPLGLTLDSPQQGSTVELVEETGSIDHDFTVSSDAFTGDWYYDFELVNGNGTVVGSETSTTYSGVTQQFTETVQGVEEGSYTYNVSVYDNSDNSQIITKSKSYNVDFNPTQDAEILSPDNGSVYMIGENQNDRTVEIQYRVEAKETDVDTDLTVNGQSIDTQTVTSGTTETFTTQTQALTQGTYTASLTTTDGQGREVNAQTNFDVVPFSEEDTVPEIQSVTFEPALTEAEAGDEIDIFVTGSGVPDDVDNVELQVQFGNQTEIITIQQDELTEGSWNYVQRNAFTLAASYVGLDTYVKGILTDIAGRINTFYKSFGVTSSETSISARLDTPVDGDKITQVDGDEETVAFTGVARADSNQADWSLVVEGQSLASGTIPADGEVDVEEYFAPSTWSPTQFGQYDARIRVEDTVTGDVQTSTTNTFEVLNQTAAPVLTFEQPRDNKIFRINPAEQRRDVNLLFETELQQGQTGTYTVNIKDRERNTTTEYTDFDREVTQAEVDNGFAERRITIPFNRGVYSIEVVFETDDGQYSLDETKNIEVTEREEVAEGNVQLGTPTDGTDLIQSRGFYFVTEAQTNAEAGDDGYVVTTIDDSGGNVVEQFNNTIKPGSANSLQNFFPSGNNLGEYTWSAELYDSNGSLLDSSETNGFTITELSTPTNTFETPNNGQVYQTDEAVEFEYTVRAYERTLQSEARIRKAGTFDTLLLSEGSVVEVPAGDSVTVNTSRADLSPGKYEWFVRNSYNPEWDSEVRTFTVESSELQEPVVELVRPEQGVTFEYDTGQNYSTVSFDSIVEVFSEADSNVELLVEEVSEDSEYESYDYGTLTNDDGETNLTKELQLTESGYRWKVNVTQGGESYLTNSRSFVVDDPETEAVPELPTQDDEENIIDRATDAFSNFLGERGQFMFSILFILATSSFLTVVTRSEKIGLSAMILLALGFSITGWIPSWIAAVFTFLSVGVAIFITSRVMGGMR